MYLYNYRYIYVQISLTDVQHKKAGGKAVVSATTVDGVPVSGEVVKGEVIPPSADGTTTVQQPDGKVVTVPAGTTCVKQADGTVVPVPEGSQAIKQPDGSVVVVPAGTKIVYKNTTNTEYIVKTEYVVKEGQDRPSSVMGQNLPSGPGEYTGYIYVVLVSTYIEP